MTLEELFKRLSYGPFSNLALGSDGTGIIIGGKQGMIVDHLNDALLRLYSRFVLREEEVIVEQRDGVTLYTISSKNAVSYLDTDPANPAYVIDSEANPYKDDLLKVLSVWDANGVELPLNIEGSITSIFTPQSNVLQVPFPVEGKILHVLYQARHIPLATTLPIDVNVTFEIPAVLEQALIQYIAYKVYSDMNGQEHQAKAVGHLTMYDNLCVEVIERDLVGSSQSMEHSKLDDRGFV